MMYLYYLYSFSKWIIFPAVKQTVIHTHNKKNKINFFNKTFGYIQPLYISMYVGVGTFTLFSFSIVLKPKH